ncbi:MAG: glutamate-1-semialdehyde-2,1-aminomutase [Planctomycetes bacterium]|jgi:glutamate-1-semialdehyde 2,1-aminomutase|nr:glutamate-1-semialdehyde-2,1-aminomutase [Planctomycetota bacterium]
MVEVSDLLERSRRAMPGGVSSPVRAFGAVPGDPPLVASANGAEIVDADGKRYIDLVGSWGPLILGHAHPAVVEAVAQAARKGLTFGATCPGEVELAEAILERFPLGERVRFVSSGTEAVMSAVRLARGATGRARIVKFEGCYHGHSDGLLVQAGSGLATFGTPSSAGVPEQIAELTDVVSLNDEEALTQLFAERGHDIAAILIEPMPANAGLLLQRPEFLAFLRKLTREHGALLIFDEVISGFRVAPGGMTELSGITPDLVTLGKIVGGGMPVGAYLGSAALMEQVAPNGPVYQAGTLSGNPLAMAAGLATLHELAQPGVYEGLEEKGRELQQGLAAALARHAIPANVARLGSVLWLNLQEGEAPRDFGAIDSASAERYGRIHRDLLERGVWMAPSAYEVAFLSTAHTDDHIERILQAFETSIVEAKAALV